jgi:hypothetical protein
MKQNWLAEIESLFAKYKQSCRKLRGIKANTPSGKACHPFQERGIYSIGVFLNSPFLKGVATAG